MTTRNDIAVDFEQSPRLLQITSASEELTVQDSHDTLADLQDTPKGGTYPLLVETAGKEPLGGGVNVGLTTVLKNAQYAFQATSPIESGTVTTPSATLLIDSTALFQTNLVKRGDWIINFTDQSVTEILSVDSEIQCTTRGLRDGIGNTFDSADAYKVWEVREAVLTGGNFTAVDDMDADLNPAFPVFGRVFSKAASTSASIKDGGDIVSIRGSEDAAIRLEKGVSGNVYATVAGVPTTTSIPTSGCSPAHSGSIPNQFATKVITFNEDTITVALRGQVKDVVSSTAAADPVLTITPALTATPVVGDTFTLT